MYSEHRGFQEQSETNVGHFRYHTHTHEYFRRLRADVGKELAVGRWIACACTASNS